MTAAITDFTQFAELRLGANNDDPAVLREVAGQFEALFLQTMLKTMREASLGDPIMGDSNGLDMFQSMLDQQLAVEMSSGEGIGLADLLVRQLGSADSGRDNSKRSLNHDRLRSNKTESSLGHAAMWRDPESFARDAWPHAKRVAERLNVAPEAVLAQAALETGWGRHVMAARDGSTSNNLFGIKASYSWNGDSVARKTIEYEDGAAHREVAQFRAYDAVADSFDDYYDFLSSNPRYAAVRDHGQDIDGFASALADSGYATDPAYAGKISRVANGDTMRRVLAQLKSAPAMPIRN